MTRSASPSGCSSSCAGSTPRSRSPESAAASASIAQGRGEPVGEHAAVRAMGVEQSNSSLVIDDRIVLKVFRKLEPGINPELEVLRFLTAREFPYVAELYGWYDYDGTALAATLGVAQQYVAGAVDGWSLALDNVTEAPGLAARAAGRARDGHGTAAQHARLRCLRPRVQPRGAEPGGPVAADGDGRRGHRADLPAPARRRARGGHRRPRPGCPRAAGRPLAGRGRRPGDPHPWRLPPRPDPLRSRGLDGHRLRGRARPRAARAPRQALAAARRRRPAAIAGVRDERIRAASRPAGARGVRGSRPASGSWRHTCARSTPRCCRRGEAATANLLSVFELEKAIYELQYELDNRPDWVAIPVAGIRRLLEADA